MNLGIPGQTLMTYLRPHSLNEALASLAEPDLRVLAGGTDIMPAQQGRDLNGDVLDLGGISELSGVTQTSDGWRIGAATRWAGLKDANLPPAFDALIEAASQIGSVQIQNRGTLSGNLCNASPAADGVPALLVLDAEIELMSLAGRRVVPLADFITGPRQTLLQPGELVTSILVPAASGSGRSGFLKLGVRKYLVISVAMVAVRLEISEGHIQHAQIAVGACSPVAQRLRGLEQALRGLSPAEPAGWNRALHADVDAQLSPIDDVRAPATYRTTAVCELVDRAIARVAGL